MKEAEKNENGTAQKSKTINSVLRDLFQKAKMVF